MGHIYWIASYPKSGNTWMRAFLGNLVGADGEAGNINRLGEIAPDENLGKFYQPFLRGPIASAELAELAAARPRVHQAIANSIEGFGFLKTHSVLARHLGTATISPPATAGAVYIVRNPLDVAVSYSRFRNWSIEETTRIVNMRGRLMPRSPRNSYVLCGSWAENVRSWTRQRHDRLLVVRYEDMLGHPETTFGAVARLLKIDASARQIETAWKRSSFKALQAEEQRLGFVERPPGAEVFFREGRSNQWRDALTPDQVLAIALPNKAIMQDFGYWTPQIDEYAEQLN